MKKTPRIMLANLLFKLVLLLLDLDERDFVEGIFFGYVMEGVRSDGNDKKVSQETNCN